MIIQQPEAERSYRTENVSAGFAVVGGGVAGVCAAVTAAREGVRVVLLQDRPVLGGNASSEVRLWMLGATAHEVNNNRWAREGGVVGEIYVENLHRNPEGNPVIFDTVLLDTVLNEPNITLLLNTALIECHKDGAETIGSVQAFCSQNSTMYEIDAPLYCDASGDGALGFLAGAAFRMGAELKEEFGEGFAPDAEFGELLGHSIYFYSRDAGRPVRYVAPGFALHDIETKIPRYRHFQAGEDGCRLWWIEYGGRLDTVHDTETIKWELWKVVYGVWDYIKNSGKFPDAANLTLEWVGTIPGKRESRRFEGDYMLRQQDVVQGGTQPDAVAYGGWMLDIHPGDGVYSEKPGCLQYNAKAPYQIPYRCYYSRNVKNLFLAGRIISASHVAFSSSRVMATCAHGAQAVGMAAAICKETGALPAQVEAAPLQQRLLATGQHIPGLRLADPEDLARSAEISASSEMELSHLPPDGPLAALDRSRAQVLPVPAGKAPDVTFTVDVSRPTTLGMELRTCSRREGFTPDVLLGEMKLELQAGADQLMRASFDATLEEPRYLFYCLMKNDAVLVRQTEQRLSAVLALTHGHDQSADEDLGVESFEMWLPGRRPEGRNLACQIDPPLAAFGARNVVNGVQRPTNEANVWLAAVDDPSPSLALKWPEPRSISRLELFFDVDYDHPMETVLRGHPEAEMPFCVRDYTLKDADGNVLASVTGNHQARNTVKFAKPVTTTQISIQIDAMNGLCPAAVFEFRVYP